MKISKTLIIWTSSMFMNLVPKVLVRQVSTTSTITTTRKLLKSSKISKSYKKFAIHEAQKILTHYLHETRCLPFNLADHICKNSLISLLNLIVKVPFSSSGFFRNFEKYIRYHPIDEFEFFFESIGIDYKNVVSFNKVFISEDRSILNAACELSTFGFPWDKLGILYSECSSIFRRNPKDLKCRLYEFKKYGFDNVEVVGICLAFPYVLGEEGEEVNVEISGLFSDLKSVFLDFGLAKSVEENVDSWHEVCRKIRVFFDLNGEKGKLGEIMGMAKNIFIEYGEDELIQKAYYFCRFGVKKEEVAILLLKAPELLNLDLQMPVISVPKILKHFGLSHEILEDIGKMYCHVLGTNKMVNLPNVMRALSLHEWFYNKLKDGNHKLLISYLASHSNEDRDKEYQAGLEVICVSRTKKYRMSKLNFLHGLGFGENALTIYIATLLHGNSLELQKKFELLLHWFEFSSLCIMVKKAPKILNQTCQVLDEKVKFFCQEMGIPFQCLIPSAMVLYFSLENCVRPRHRFHMWLKEKGLFGKKYSIVTVFGCSHVRFVNMAYKIHPAAPKHWFEQFYIPPC